MFITVMNIRRIMNLRWFGLALIGAWTTLAANSSPDSPMSAVLRDLDRYIGCRLQFDLDCLVETTYSHLNATATSTRPIPADRLESLRPQYESAKAEPRSRLRTIEYDMPLEPFRAGTQFFTVVPYRLETPAPGAWLTENSFFLGISDDAGATWRFVEGETLHPDRIDLIIPGYRSDLLPPAYAKVFEALQSPAPVRSEVIMAPTPARSEYLRTTDASFEFDGESAAYSVLLDVRKRVASEITLSVYFDDPSSAGRPDPYHVSLSPSQKKLEIVSPAMRGFEGGEHYGFLIIGSDAATGAKLFEHRQELLFGVLDPPRIAYINPNRPHPGSL
jgi:hypothetical protein